MVDINRIVGGPQKTRLNPGVKYSDEWYTPPEIYARLGAFDLDPACGPLCKNRIAAQSFSEGGLVKPWFGRVWLNPPFSRVDKWADKFVEHNDGIMLVFARTDAAWFHWLLRACGGGFFLVGRVQFTRPALSVDRPNNQASTNCPVGCALFPGDKDKVARPNKRAILESGIRGKWLSYEGR